MLLLLLCACKEDTQRRKDAVKVASDSQRIISFAPALTEILFALGLGDRVIAVSSFCRYPPEVQKLPKAGGFLDPNLEAVVRLKPDCVVVYNNHNSVLDLLKRLKVPALIASGDNLAEIQETIGLLGDTFKRQQQAAILIGDMQDRLQKIRLSLPSGQRRTPSVMLVVWRERGQGTLKNITVAGNDQYYSEMIANAGGVLLPGQTKLEYPTMGLEGIMQLNPELIIEIAPELEDKPEKLRQQTKDDWRRLPELKAVQEQNIFIISDDYAAIPGPRCILLAEKIAALLTPFVSVE